MIISNGPYVALGGFLNGVAPVLVPELTRQF